MPAVPTSKQLATNGRGGRRADFFGEVARTYANHYAGTGTPSAYFFHRRQTLVMKFLRSVPGGAILDVGCGPGVYAKACVERGFRYRGLDASPGMIAEGRRRFGDLEGAELTVGDARRVLCPSASFDAVLCLGMLEYLSREDEAICLQELNRVLKPGGVIVFSFLNAASPYWLWIEHCYPLLKFVAANAAALVGRSKWTRLRDCKHRRPTRRFRLAERLGALRRQQLSIERSRYFSMNVLPRPLDRLTAPPSVWVSSTLEPMLSVPGFGWLGMAFIVVARKRVVDASPTEAASVAAHVAE